jgi:hypothetical protein
VPAVYLFLHYISKCQVQNNVGTLHFVSLYKSPSETLQMLEGSYEENAASRVTFCDGRLSVNDDFGGFSLMLRISPRRAFCKQRIVLRNPPSPQGCGEKGMSRKIGIKQPVTSAQQRTCTLVIGGQIYLAKHNVAALVHLPYSPDLSLPNLKDNGS